MYYTKILDHDGNILLENTTKTRQVLKDTTAWLLTSAMEDVVTKGTGARVRFDNMAIAGKTGTTSSNVDVWFAGFTPYYTASTWAGYDNNVHMNGSGETNTAKNLWRAIMSRVHSDLPYKSFVMPSGIKTATVCAESGLLPLPSCPTNTDYFAVENIPTETCEGHDPLADIYNTGLVCAMAGEVANETCPYAYAGVATVPNRFCAHSTINGMQMNDYVAALSAQAAAAAGLAAGGVPAATDPVTSLPAIDPATQAALNEAAAAAAGIAAGIDPATQAAIDAAAQQAAAAAQELLNAQTEGAVQQEN